MTFLNPAMLAGLFAIGLPVVIHLLIRPRFREMSWAAMQFLLPSLKKSRRLSSLEDFFLLLLRCLLVALLVLIFARPALLVDPASLAAPEKSSARVLILDQSASMGRSDGLRTRFDHAKAEAETFVNALPPDSALAVFLATQAVNRPVAKPTRNLTEVRAALAAAALTERGSDLYPAIKAAVNLLKRQAVGQREIVLFTDGQAIAWRQLPAIRKLIADSPGISLNVRVVDGENDGNLSISSIRPQSAFISVDQSFSITIEVTNHGTAPVYGIPVKLGIDENAPAAEQVIARLEPGASQTVTLPARFATPGPHSLTALLPADQLAFDNHRTFALRVLPQLQVLVVEGEFPAERGLRDGYFINRALVPIRAKEAGSHFIKTTLGTATDLGSSRLDRYQLVFLSNLSRLTAAEAQNLRRYVNAGNTLVVFPGPATQVEFFNRDPDLAALLPARLSPARAPTGQNKTLPWQSRDYTHPLTSLWNNPAAGNLGGIQVSKYFPLELDQAAVNTGAAQVVVAYGNGEPAVVTRSVGTGRVILFSSAATPAWSTLPLQQAFVPLLLRIAAQSGGELSEGLNLSPGEAFTAPLGVNLIDAPVAVSRPGNAGRHAAGTVEASGDAGVLRYHDTAQTGAYRLYVGDEKNPRVLFAVQADAAESDPASLAPGELKTLSSPAPGAAPATVDTPPHSASAARVPGPELWATFALVALILALVETAFAHYFSRHSAP